MWSFPRPTPVFWLLIKIFIDIVILLMIAKTFYLADILFSSFVFLDNVYIDPCHWSAALLATITVSVWPRFLFIWSRSAQTRLRRLFISIVSESRRRRLLSLNIFFKIISSKKSMSLGTLIIHVLKECQRLTSSFYLNINCFLDGFFQII